MRRLLPTLAVILLLPLGHAGERGSRVMSGWFGVTTADGWQGRRYMDGQHIFAEEFDSNGDGRIDVWRFYRRGMLSSEERDFNGDGRVNLQTHWDPKNLRLLSVFRDTNRRGVNDLEIEATGSQRWEIREDRNLDGIADRILLVNGPPDLFDYLGIDLATQQDVIDAIPRSYWHELWLDNGFSGEITEYYRFTRGVLTHRGDWSGKKFAWVRCEPDYIPPSPPPLAQAGPTPVAPPPGMPRAADAARDPFSFGGADADPYDAGGGMPAAAGVYPDPVPQPYAEPFPDPVPPPYAEPYADPMAQPAYPPPGGGSMRDRRRYEGLPPGESAARSVPARMRPPGTSRR